MNQIKSKSVEFTFSFDEKGKNETGFIYPSKTPILNPNDKLTFKFQGADAVTIYFGWNSPFNLTQIALVKNNKSGMLEGQIVVNEYAPDGKYKFYVAIMKNIGKVNKIIVDDPDVIIRRGSRE